MENICNKEVSYEGRKISDDLKALLTSILEKDPKKRASLEEIKNSRFLTLDSLDLELSMHFDFDSMASQETCIGD